MIHDEGRRCTSKLTLRDISWHRHSGVIAVINRILSSCRFVLPPRPVSRWALIGAAAATIAGCGSSAVDQVANVLERAGTEGTGEAVALDSVASGEWTRLFLFGPYTQPAHIANCLEIRSARRLARGIKSMDNMHLLVVETRSGRYQSRELLRSKVDFSEAATGAAYTPTTARFVANRTEWDSVQLRPEAEPAMRCWPLRNGSDSDTELHESETGVTQETLTADKSPPTDVS
jgi:hypothetical protein